MRRRDKLKNIQKVNRLLETRSIKELPLKPTSDPFYLEEDKDDAMKQGYETNSAEQESRHSKIAKKYAQDDEFDGQAHDNTFGIKSEASEYSEREETDLNDHDNTIEYLINKYTSLMKNADDSRMNARSELDNRYYDGVYSAANGFVTELMQLRDNR